MLIIRIANKQLVHSEIGPDTRRPIPAVLNSSPRAPPLCIYCMSLLVNTPDSDNQLVRSALRA